MRASYRPSAVESAQMETYAEAAIEANAAMLGGSVLRPQGARLWSPTNKLSGAENAFEHFKKHGHEFPGINNAKEYVSEAYRFFMNPPSGTLRKVRGNGDIILLDPKSDTFGVFMPDGTARTMSKPDPAKHGYPCNLDYFNAQ